MTSPNFRFFHFFHENVFVFDIVSIFVEIFLSSYVWFKSVVYHPPVGERWGHHHVMVPYPRDITHDIGPPTGSSLKNTALPTGYHRFFSRKKVMSPPFPDRGMVHDRFERHINHLHFLIYSIATKLGRQVDGVDIYKLEQKIHNGAHIVLPSALFSFCKETPWYTLTQFLTSSF